MLSATEDSKGFHKPLNQHGIQCEVLCQVLVTQPVCQTSTQQACSIKAPIAIILGFMSQTVSVETTQLLHCRAPATIDDTQTNEHERVLIKFY